MTLIIYDDQGQIFSQITGNYLVPQGGVQFIEVEVPEGKRVAGVDVSAAPHQVILEDIPPSEFDILKQSLAETNAMLLEFMESTLV